VARRQRLPLRRPRASGAGAYSGIYYSLANRGFRAIGLEGDTNHLVRPQPLMRSYLLLRNEVYARALAEGWHPITLLLH
jgi:hypothetical protein